MLIDLIIIITACNYDSSCMRQDEDGNVFSNAPKLIKFFFVLAPVVLRRYLHSVHGDLEQTKKLIEHSYSLRHKYPNIFCNRDPIDADVQKVFLVA